jgi:hypothetical protein
MAAPILGGAREQDQAIFGPGAPLTLARSAYSSL